MHLSLVFSTLLLPFALTLALPRLPRSNSDTLDTRNDLLNGTPCKPVTIVFARGTIEPGNVGLLAGPPFFAALDLLIGSENIAVQGVDYPASILGYLEGGDAGGSATLAQLAETAVRQCPGSKLILSGYSQGAQLVHNGAAELSPTALKKVTGVVMFGDPDDGEPIAGVPTAKIDTICITGDLICDGLPFVDLDHLAYGFTAPQAAEFVAKLL